MLLMLMVIIPTVMMAVVMIAIVMMLMVMIAIVIMAIVMMVTDDEHSGDHISDGDDIVYGNHLN